MAGNLSRRSLNLCRLALQFRPQRYVTSSPASLYNQQPYRSITLPSHNFVRSFSISFQRYDVKATVNIETLGGESENGATVQSFHYKVGDYVEQHDVPAVIETDKVAIEVPAPKKGVIQNVFVEKGDTVTVGQAVAEITVKS